MGYSIIAYYYNTWNDDQTYFRLEEVANGCTDLEIHAALRDFLSLKDISVREWAIERLAEDPRIKREKTFEDMIKHGEKLIREQND